MTDKTFLLTPFTSLGLVAEGGASYMFVKKLGLAKANEALLLSKRISAQELLECGFANKIFPAEGFRERVLEFVDDLMGDNINHESMLDMKKLIRGTFANDLELANTQEAFIGLEKWVLPRVECTIVFYADFLLIPAGS